MSRLIFVIKGHLVNVGARFAREHALAEEPRNSRRFRWWHLEPEVLATGGDEGAARGDVRDPRGTRFRPPPRGSLR